MSCDCDTCVFEGMSLRKRVSVHVTALYVLLKACLSVLKEVTCLLLKQENFSEEVSAHASCVIFVDIMY